VFDRVLRALAYCAGAVLLGLMALILFDVLMRYVLRLPFLGGFELTELLMVLVVFLALPYCAATNGHVSVDVFARQLDRPRLRWILVPIHLAGAALMILIAWQATVYAAGSAGRGEASQMLKVPGWPFEVVTAASAAVFAVVLLNQAWRVLRPSPRAESRQ
jgi:TRAP-type C4-dicarboxylate transport system permease small subunit